MLGSSERHLSSGRKVLHRLPLKTEPGVVRATVAHDVGQPLGHARLAAVQRAYLGEVLIAVFDVVRDARHEARVADQLCAAGDEPEVAVLAVDVVRLQAAAHGAQVAVPALQRGGTLLPDGRLRCHHALRLDPAAAAVTMVRVRVVQRHIAAGVSIMAVTARLHPPRDGEEAILSHLARHRADVGPALARASAGGGAALRLQRLQQRARRRELRLAEGVAVLAAPLLAQQPFERHPAHAGHRVQEDVLQILQPVHVDKRPCRGVVRTQHALAAQQAALRRLGELPRRLLAREARRCVPQAVVTPMRVELAAQRVEHRHPAIPRLTRVRVARLLCQQHRELVGMHQQHSHRLGAARGALRGVE
eukprot:scaffold27953_cov75-Phaeocystis_antarctica.AAC.5